MTDWKKFFAKRGPARRLIQGMFTGLLVGSGVLIIANMGVLNDYEVRTVDLRMDQLRDPRNVTDKVTVLAIDEETVRALERAGRKLPFPRSFWAEVITALQGFKPRAIVFDFTFKDKWESAQRPFEANPTDSLGQPTTPENYMFGDAAWTSGRVVIGVDTTEISKGAHPDLIKEHSKFEEAVAPFVLRRLLPATVNGPIPAKKAVAAGDASFPVQPEGWIVAGSRALGYVDTHHVTDPDGAIRQFAPVARVADSLLPDLAIAGLAVSELPAREFQPFSEDNRLAVKPEDGGALPSIVVLPGKAILGTHEIPLREDGMAWIRWRGVWQSDEFLRRRVISAKDLLQQSTLDIMLGVSDDPLPKDVRPSDYEDKIVLVGFTMQGDSSDYAGTPFGAQPGVFKYAATLDTILTNEFLRSPTRNQDRGLVLVVAALTGLIALGTSESLRRRSKQPFLVATAALLPGLLIGVAYFGLTFLAFSYGWILNEFPTLLSVLFTTLVCAGTVFAVAQRESAEEARRKEHFFNLARQGLGPQVVDELMKQGPDAIPRAGGQRKNLTLYFSDIAGFTTISEKLEPIELVEILNEYFERVSQILVNKHHGYLDKFIGDAVMASWGGFGADPEGSLRACRAALDARDLIEEFSNELIGRGLPPLRTRIGLNTGNAVAAWVGLPGQRWYYTAFGDTVNLASRLEGANKAYGTTIMIGPNTYEETKDSMVARELDLVRVKGKKIPVKVYELMGRAEEPLPREREIKRRYEAALVKYRARDFSGALAEFSALASEFADSPSKSYIEFCKERLESPPDASWDGSNELHDK